MRKYLPWLVGIGLAFWFPLTRRMILWMLPLGRGIDDLIQFTILVVLAVYGLYKLWIYWDKRKHFLSIDRARNKRIMQATWGVIWVIVNFVLFGSVVEPFLLYGKPLPSDFAITSGISFAVVVAGWFVIRFVFRRAR